MSSSLKRLIMSMFVVVVSVVGIPSLAHGQNLDVLSGDSSVQPAAAEPVNTPPQIEDQSQVDANQPVPGAVTPPETVVEPQTMPQPQGQVGEENTVKVDPLSDENLEAIVASTKGTITLTPDEASRYTLGPTDIIDVTVMRHPEVSGRYEINTEGRIQYEFVGDLSVSGLTKDDAAKEITTRLSEYIVSPEVTVKISGYNSKIVYVVGEVGRPGKIFMRGNTITVREALLEAGLPLLSGVTKKSSLITPSESGKISKSNINVYALLYEGDLRENRTMNPGDVLYIPPTFLTKTMRAIAPVTQPITNTAGAAGSVNGF